MTFPHHHLDIGRRSTLGNRSKRSLWVRLGRTLATVFWSRCKNGNISNIRRRLPPISLCNCRDWESGDRAATCKRPPLAGPSRIFVSTISSCQTAWLECEDSNSRIPDRTQSLREFPRIWEYGGGPTAPPVHKFRLGKRRCFRIQGVSLNPNPAGCLRPGFFVVLISNCECP